MFYKPSIKDEIFPVLEIGPGALPFKLSDVWLDIDFSEKDKVVQSGGVKPAVGKSMVYYNGKKFPFKDKAFKYVIASHVLEHVSWEDVPLFISEMERVSDAGYIELPRWTWELVNDIPTHKLTGDVRDGKLILYKKTCDHEYNFFTKIMLDKSANFREYIAKEKELFFCRIEWRKKIVHELRDDEYQIANGKEGIADILKNDLVAINNSDSKSSVPPSIEEIKCVSSRFVDKIFKNLAPKKNNSMRVCMNENKMTQDILQCPKCLQKIDSTLHCSGCDFYFNKKGITYFPHY